MAGVRWAEAVYAHVVQHGTLQVPGLNRPTGGADDDLFDVDAALFALAIDWAALADAAPDPDLLQRSRQSADLPTILDALAGAAIAGAASEATLANGFERLLLVQLETVLQRERSGAGTLRLEAIERSVNAAIAADELPAAARTLFATLCQRVRRGNGVSRGDDPDSWPWCSASALCAPRRLPRDARNRRRWRRRRKPRNCWTAMACHWVSWSFGRNPAMASASKPTGAGSRRSTPAFPASRRSSTAASGWNRCRVGRCATCSSVCAAMSPQHSISTTWSNARSGPRRTDSVRARFMPTWRPRGAVPPIRSRSALRVASATSWRRCRQRGRRAGAACRGAIWCRSRQRWWMTHSPGLASICTAARSAMADGCWPTRMLPAKQRVSGSNFTPPSPRRHERGAPHEADGAAASGVGRLLLPATAVTHPWHRRIRHPRRSEGQKSVQDPTKIRHHGLCPRH